MKFNKEQQEVIKATGGCHLVLAPPGCGKTAVLAERIVWAHQQGVPFSAMACLTFTNRASRGVVADRRPRPALRGQRTPFLFAVPVSEQHRSRTDCRA